MSTIAVVSSLLFLSFFCVCVQYFFFFLLRDWQYDGYDVKSRVAVAVATSHPTGTSCARAVACEPPNTCPSCPAVFPFFFFYSFIIQRCDAMRCHAMPCHDDGRLSYKNPLPHNPSTATMDDQIRKEETWRTRGRRREW